MSVTAREAARRGDFELHWLDSYEAVDEAVRDLRAMTPQARKLLAECIEHQGVKRTRLSAAGAALEEAGFVHVRELGWAFGMEEVEIRPALWGEEAMAALEVGVGKPEQTRRRTTSSRLSKPDTTGIIS